MVYLMIRRLLSSQNFLTPKKISMKGGAIISHELAKRMVDKYRHVIKYVPATELAETYAIHFDKSFLTDLLNTDKTDGMKFYFAINEEKRLTLVLIPTNENGEDLQHIEGFPHANKTTKPAHSGPIIATMSAGAPLAKVSGGAANQGNPYP